MTCELYKPPPQTKPFGANEALPTNAHAYAEAYLEQCVTSGTPLGTFKRDVLQGVPIAAQYCHHTMSGGVPGCYQAVTLFHDTSNGTAPSTGVTGSAIDWAVVAATGAAAAVAVGLFVLMLKHAGRARSR